MSKGYLFRTSDRDIRQVSGDFVVNFILFLSVDDDVISLSAKLTLICLHVMINSTDRMYNKFYDIFSQVDKAPQIN